jgi:hypothetical protein
MHLEDVVSLLWDYPKGKCALFFIIVLSVCSSLFFILLFNIEPPTQTGRLLHAAMALGDSSTSPSGLGSLLEQNS